MSNSQAVTIPIATLSNTIEEGLELAFQRIAPSECFEERLASFRSDGADVEELNDICEDALLHEASLQDDDRTKIVIAHRALNSILKLDGRGARRRLSQLLRESEGSDDLKPANDDGAPEPFSRDRVWSLLSTGVIDGFFASEGAIDPRIWASEFGYRPENRLTEWKELCARAMRSECVPFSELSDLQQEAISFTRNVLEGLEYVASQFERGFYE